MEEHRSTFHTCVVCASWSNLILYYFCICCCYISVNSQGWALAFWVCCIQDFPSLALYSQPVCQVTLWHPLYSTFPSILGFSHSPFAVNCWLEGFLWYKMFLHSDYLPCQLNILILHSMCQSSCPVVFAITIIILCSPPRPDLVMRFQNNTFLYVNPMPNPQPLTTQSPPLHQSRDTFRGPFLSHSVKSNQIRFERTW